MTAVGDTANAPVRHQLNTRRTGIQSASRGLARRSLVNITRLPSAFLPSILMPVIQAIAFSGTFFAITQVPGFPTDRSINWFLPLAVLMGTGFAGIGIGFTTITDLESGFYDRIRLAPAPRTSLIVGPLMAAIVRALIVTTIVLIVGALFGARLTHGPIGLVYLYIAGLGVATFGTGWGLGLAYRFRDMRAAAVMQLTFFLLLFLTEAQAPLDIMEGWLEGVTRVNPINNVIRLARVGFVDEPITLNNGWGGVAAVVGISALTLLFARRSLQRLSDS